jgi:small subunit ribosomal protein S20
LANTKSAEKRWRQSLRRRMRNRAAVSTARTYIRDTVRTIHAGTPDPDKLKLAIIALDKAAEKGIIHKNNAARRKSRLMSQFARVESGAAAPSAPKTTRSRSARAIRTARAARAKK